jgi:CHASE3 domain sensor protein
MLAIVASPIFVQAQETSAAKMKEEAQKVVKIISSDKSKTQTYCDLVKVSNQIEQAEPNSKADQCISKWTNWPLNWGRNISS